MICSGCDRGGKESVGSGTGDTSTDPYPDIRGSWSGSFFRTDVLGSTPVKATIGQDKDALSIRTDLLPGVGKSFTGTITTAGEMSLTDGYDGESWTSYFGAARTNYIKIADFITPPTIEDPHPPLHIIELRN